MSAEHEDKTAQNWMKEVQKGYIRIGVLILLNKKPAHGYEIMKEINSRTKGFWQPTAGGVYPVLNDLEKSGYVRGEWRTDKNRRIKVYCITKSGEAILKRAIVKQTEISNNISNLFYEFARDVLNVEAGDKFPMMPSLFTPFLKEKAGGETLAQLEHQRRHIRESAKTMQERLREINRQIAELKKAATDAASQMPK